MRSNLDTFVQVEIHLYWWPQIWRFLSRTLSDLCRYPSRSILNFFLILDLSSSRWISVFWIFDHILIFDCNVNTWTATFLPVAWCRRNHPTSLACERWDAQPLGIGYRRGREDGMDMEWDGDLNLQFYFLKP